MEEIDTIICLKKIKKNTKIPKIIVKLKINTKHF